MKTRRIFIKDCVNISLKGGILLMAPTEGFSTVLKKTSENFEPHEFDAWEDEFQALYKEKKQVDLVIQEMTKKKTFSRGESKNGSKKEIKDFYTKANYKNNVRYAYNEPKLKREPYPYFKKVPSIMTSPYSNLNLYENKSNVLEGNQCFRVDKHEKKDIEDTYLMIFTKNNVELSQDVDKDYLLVHPDFSDIIGNKKYFCYGIPAEMPRIGYCKNCSLFFATQVFCYQANDPMYGVGKKYTQMIKHFQCPHPKHKFHNGVSSISDLVPCVCYDAEIETQIIDSGNLDD